MTRQEQPTNQENQAGRQNQGAFLCEHCEAETREDIVKAAVWNKGGLTVIEDIPARTCERCGEQFFDEDTIRKIQELISEPPSGATREIPVAVFSLNDVTVPQRPDPPAELDEAEMKAIESTFSGMEDDGEGAGENQEDERPIVCTYCKSETHEDIVKSAFWVDRGLVAVEDIPARVCTECGEQFYNDETTRKIDALMEQDFPPEKASREIAVPVFPLAQVQSAE